ncbi:MAG: mannitol dehydrogenase family protein [Amylibacter sp.]|nr:mannitol dehydrogenase family protein [Amylibacter sp.]|tara:strand:+ start:5407 stop:6828 length:1422 start_codon:yes stop_codon:yes gene_type:complete
MNSISKKHIFATEYERSNCKIGVVHLGFGAFHRAHQAVYLDDYMAQSGDLNWGIAAVNLRLSEYDHFQAAAADISQHDGYFLKSYSADGQVELRRVRSHVGFYDWCSDINNSQKILALDTVHLVTITVTESGYYTDANGDLIIDDPHILNEINNNLQLTVYGYLRASLLSRVAAGGAPLTIACCDNIRQNGKMLQRNLLAYLKICNDTDLISWVTDNVAFPSSMVDRITPRTSLELSIELSELIGIKVSSPIMAEDFTQWVLQDNFSNNMPNLTDVGVTITSDIDPYEETKIRVLNGGHTALTYLAALEKIRTFDMVMQIPHLFAHFKGFECEEVLPALTIELPFSKYKYLEKIEQRFNNQAIGDTVSRICADGMAKFPIFIRPTLEGCFAQGIIPIFSIRSIASWHQFAQHVLAGKVDFDYLEPSWDSLSSMLGRDEFINSRQLWGEIPKTYPKFAEILRLEIFKMEQKWPV